MNSEMMPLERQQSLDTHQFSEIIQHSNQLTKNKQLQSCIEDLPNELLYKIFEYLDSYDIYHSLSNLNIHFQTLISSPYLRLKIEYEYDLTTEFENHYERYIHSNRHQIISLHLRGTFIINKFFSISTLDSSFVNLQSIVLENLSSLKFAILLFYFRNLSCLSSLSIWINEIESDEIGDIYRMIFQLSSLKYLKIDISNSLIYHLNLSKINFDEQSSIEYLSIGHLLNIDELFELLFYIPRLKHLYCMTNIQTNSIDSLTISNRLENLVHLSLSLRQIHFNEFEVFLLQICSYLRVLSVAFYWTDQSYLEPIRWQNLIVKYMPNLERFRFQFTEKLNEEFEIKPFTHHLIDGFYSSFWSDHRWFYRICIDADSIVHSILPTGISSQDVYELEYLVMEENDGVSMMISFDRYNIPDKVEFFETIFNKIRPLFDIVQITRLLILLNQNNYSTFIRILHLLPNLDLLCIRVNTSIRQLRLHYVDRHEFRRFLTHNQITKLTLIDVIQLEEISFFVNLFPRVNFYTFNILHYRIAVKFFVEYTIKTIRHHPATVCFIIYEATVDLVEQLRHMITSKNLLENFTINRQYEKFYIQWK